MNRAGDPIHRFWSNVDMGTEVECWNWTGSRTRGGYGRIKVAGKWWRAHRYAWLLKHGTDPGEFFVCHRCDNPPCVNTSHLFLGTHLENMRDCSAKGRKNPGSLHPNYGRTFGNSGKIGEANAAAKLSEEQVREIRSLCANGAIQRRVAERYGVAPMTISAIVCRKIWAHVA